MTSMISHHRNTSAQSATSYVVVTGVIVAGILILAYVISDGMGDINTTQTMQALETIEDAVFTLHPLGMGTTQRALIYLPPGITQVTITNNVITYTLSQQDISATLALPIHGTLPINEGTYSVNLFHNGTKVLIYQCGNNVIEALEQCDGVDDSYCFLGCVGPGEAGECNCRCLTQENCVGTVACITPDIGTGYCAACTKNSECPPSTICRQGKCSAEEEDGDGDGEG